MIRLAGEVPRFLVVGTLTVLVDFAVHFLLLSAGLSVPSAKAES